ncbi:chromosome partitioning protein (plasmid) [Spiroplasma ixodetis Y32]|nr:chromosome partitioning protein [Spiroplasma ixodetis Y32]
MKMISFAVKKGGVGKTTLCKNIAYKLALENKKVLLIDLDPQATLSMQFCQISKIDENKSLIKILNAIDLISLNKIIQQTKYKNLDIISGSENLNKSTTLINTFYSEKEKYLLSDLIYKNNQKIFDSYDYVLIDYPPTIQELALNFLILSDLIVIPINSGSGSFKGLIDLKNTINQICRQENREAPNMKIVFNNIKDNENTKFIFNWLKDEALDKNLSNNIIKNSDTFIKTENDLDSIWTNPYYWRQKQAYEELIAEIL